MDKVQMKALKFGTVSGERGILHTDDRKEADQAAQYPLVSEADAQRLERDGLAERFDGQVPTAEGDADGDGDVNTDEYSLRETENVAEAEDSVEVTTGLATRATTAFEAEPEALATGDTGRSITVEDSSTAPASPDDAPAGGGGKSLSSMTTAELTATAEAESVDISSATNNPGRVELIQAARDAKSTS